MTVLLAVLACLAMVAGGAVIGAQWEGWRRDRRDREIDRLTGGGLMAPTGGWLFVHPC